MTTIKSFTSIEQSKVLVEILPLESADMRYGYIAPYDYSDRMYDGGYDEIPYPKDFLIKNPNFSDNEYDAELPCWSLAALLNYLKSKNKFPEIKELSDGRFKLTTYIWDGKDCIQISIGDSIIDASYEMVICLNELNLL